MRQLLTIVTCLCFAAPVMAQDADFAARCTAAGVIRCENFDDAADFTPATGSNPGLHNVSPIAAFQDTATKHSGASSLRFDILGNTPANHSGDFVAAFSPKGENTDFYIQYQQMMDTQMVTYNWGNTGSGVGPKSIIVHGVVGTTCQQTQFVTAAFTPIQPGNYPVMYSECGQRNMYTNLAGDAWACPTCTPLLIQQPESGSSGYKCQYGVYGDGTGDGTGCYKVPANKWVTFYYKIHVGTWGSANSTVDAWVAVDGGAYKQFVKVPNMTLNNAYQAQDNNFSRIMLTTYMTGKNPAVAHATAKTWFDELIVSTSPIAAPVVTAATTRYIKSSCTNAITTFEPIGDTCTGGSKTVYSSLANALSAGTTVAGDTLEISAGTYAERLNTLTQTLPSGTDFAIGVVTIKARAAATVTLRPSGGAEVFNIVSGNHHIIFDRIIIDASLQSSGEGISFGGGSHHIRYQDGEVKQSWNMNIFGSQTAGSGIEILRTALHGAGRDGNGYGAYVEADGWLFEGNDVYGNAGYGLHFYNGQSGGTSDGHIIRNNKVHDNLVGSATNGGCAPIDGSNNSYYNNLFYGNTGSICLDIGWSGSSSNLIDNNTISHNGTGIRLDAAASGTVVRNNIVRSSVNGAGTITNSGSGSVFSNNLGCTTNCFSSADPLFTNFSTQDFTLSSNSPAGGAGVDLSAVFTTDYSGTTRTVPWSIGAYVGTGTPTLTLLNPNGGTLGVTGSTQTLTWDCSSVVAIPDVKLEYDAANDAVFETVISASTPNDCSFNFTAPAVTTTGRFKISDAADGSPSDTSDANVTITAAAGGSFTTIISDNTSGTKIGTVGGTTNSALVESNPTAIYAGNYGVRANKSSAGNHIHSVVKFPTGSIPSDVTVTAAELGLYLTAFTGAGTPSIEFRQNKRAFSQSQATYNIYATGSSWGTAGGLNNTTDRVSTVSCTMSISATTFQYYTCSDAALVTLVQGWVNGSIVNEGFHLERNGTGNDGLTRTLASNVGASDQRPYLSVTFSTTVSTITMTQPVASDHFFPGQVVGLRWDSEGLSGNVKIEISRNNGVNYESTPIVASHPFDQADATWIASGPACTQCVVKATSLNDSTKVSVSPPFKFAGTRRVMR